MNRLQKLLAAATLLVLPVIAACGEDPIVPPATGSIQGQVSIEGMGIDGVSVNLSSGASTTTAGGGTYRFDDVLAGAYTVTISGFPADASFDATSAAATIPENGGSVTLDFRGSYIRTASIMGTVTVENTGLGGVTVRLSGMADSQTATDNNGQYAFTGLRAGTYSVEISGFDMDEVGFGSIESGATVGVGESKIISFDGTYLRTAGIKGQVSVEGVGLAGVTVTMTGEGEDETDVTDAGGLYGFSKLKAGNYSVAISGFDPDEVEFTSTSMNVSVALGETANVPFDGTLLRTSGISGRVSLDDGMGLDGVEVVLAGAAEDTKMTSNGGQYAFAGLAEGTYVVSMTNPNETAYTFETTTATIVLGDAESNITNFEGTHTRTASVSGMAFLDEAPADGMYTANEPPFAHAGIPVILQGPGVNDVLPGMTGEDGSYAFEGLMAGSYRVLINMTEEVAGLLAMAGFAYKGDLTGEVVSVEAGGSARVNFAFGITTQTIGVGAVMGNAEETGDAVMGVELALYPTAQDAEDGTNMLGEGTTDEMGMASFDFARADDSSPGSEESDNLVFVKVTDAGHADLMVSDNDVIEIEYPGTARVHSAPAHVRLLNVGVSFDFWVKNNETARDGDKGLGGWATEVFMGDPDAEDAMPLMKPDPDDDMEMVNATEPTNDGEENMDHLGKSMFSYTVDPTMLPATFHVRAAMDDEAECEGTGLEAKSDQPDQCEVWEQSDALMHTHTGLDLPLGEDDDMTDLGPIRITYTTQAVYVGTHRELDDRTGFTDYIGLDDGDARPTDKGNAIGEIEVSLMVADSRGRLNVLEYDHDLDEGEKTDDVEATATFGASGIVSFAHIPSDTEITIVADAGSGMVILPDTRASTEIDAYGDQLDDFPDGKIVGAFGDGSGARPDVWICPLWRLDHMDPNDNCSTFAYKWADGTISGSISGLRKGDKATVNLVPVRSNDDYSDDLEDDDDVTAGTGGAAKFSFDGVADGEYKVVLEANPGSWEENEDTGIKVFHEEDSDDDEYSGDAQSASLSATDLRGTIKGRIANDSNIRAGLTGDESRSGVMVAIHHASAAITASGPNKGRRSAGKAVVDADGDPLMAETDEDGVFEFEGLVVGGSYFLMPQGTDLYTAVRNGGAGIKDDEADDVVSEALTKAVVPDPKFKPAIPTWDSHTSTMTAGGANDFVLLYMNGEVEGEVSDPSVRSAHKYSTVELHRCKVSNFVEDDQTADPPVTGVPLTGCSTYTDDVTEASVGEDGEWIAEDLMEGVYEVIVDLPAGYVHVDVLGRAFGETDYNTGDAENTGFSQQPAELTGGRADAGTATFHIKDRNAGDGAEIEADGVTVDGEACTLSDAGDDRCVDNEHDDGSITVKATASRGATITLSTSATDPKPSGTGTRSVSVKNGVNTTVTLPAAGSTKFFVHVAAEDGYSNNATGADGAVDPGGFSVRRDADVRVNTVRLAWGGDRIDLDRDGLNLDPDGETDPVTGTTVVRVTVDTGDNDGAIPATALTVSATSMTKGFGATTWGTYDLAQATPECGAANDQNNVTISATADGVKGTGAVCLTITDNNAAGDDGNDDNTRDYILIFTRK